MKKILISADPYETRVAIVEESVVVETYVERATKRSMLGNIYLGKVDAVLPGMEAAFIDAGLPKNAFLFVGEIVLPELDDEERRKKKIEQLIKAGQSLLVQVTKDPMGMKGARVSMDVSLAGRFLVYSPDGKGYGVSKRLPDGERDRLRDLVKTLQPKTGGLIVRTAARGASLEELKRDLALLEASWAQIVARSKKAKAPAIVHAELDLALEMVRDDLRVEVDEVVTDDPATYERIRAYVEQHSPEFLPRIKLHTASTPLLRRYQVEDAIRSTMHRRVDLPSGGYLLLDYAEAFTVIDVNTGRFVGKSRLEDTILANNLEAAREVVRQLRLRDIGGMIVIDFIDMSSQKNRDAVIACLNEELKRDRSKVYLTSISPLGLVEMTRQNVTDGVREVMTTVCAVCGGEGRVLSLESIAIENLRSLRRHAALSTAEAFLVELNPEVAALMIGAGGKRLSLLEETTGKHFSLVGVESVPIERCAVTREGTSSEILAHAIPVAVGVEIEVSVDEPHMFQAADAVHFMDGGYRIVLAGAGPYLGERHRVRIDQAGRLEAHATLLSAKPVTEAEMLRLIDRRTDLHEPDRVPIERIDLEDRDRRRRAPQKKRPTAKSAGDADPSTEAEPLTVEPAAGEGLSVSARRRRRRRGAGTIDETGVTALPAVEETEAGEEESEADAEDVSDEADDDGTSTRRRRGRRGGRRHRARAERQTAAMEGGETDQEPAAAAVVAEPEALPAPRARRSRARVAVDAVAEAVVTVSEPTVEVPTAAPAPRARRSRARVVVEAPSDPPAVVADVAVVASPTAAPTRRSRARVVKEAPDTVVEASAPVAVAVTEPAPAPRRRRATAPVSDVAAGAVVAVDEASKPAPRRRRAAAPAPEVAVEEAPKPAPRRRRAAAPVVEAAAAE